MDKKDVELQPGFLVQIRPDFNPCWGGCIVFVTKVYPWGIQGYVQLLGPDRDTPGGRAFIRLKKADYEFAGCASWVSYNRDADGEGVNSDVCQE